MGGGQGEREGAPEPLLQTQPVGRVLGTLFRGMRLGPT